MINSTYNSLLEIEDRLAKLSRDSSSEMGKILIKINKIVPDNRKLRDYIQKIKADNSLMSSERYKGFLIACHLIEDYSKK